MGLSKKYIFRNGGHAFAGVRTEEHLRDAMATVCNGVAEQRRLIDTFGAIARVHGRRRRVLTLWAMFRTMTGFRDGVHQLHEYTIRRKHARNTRYAAIMARIGGR